jgi:hypothetical protein
MRRACCGGALGAVWLLVLGSLSLTAFAKDNTRLTLPKGARVGVVSMVDAEITQFHTGEIIAQTFLKTHDVDWPVGAMLEEAVQQRLTQMGLVPVPLAPGDALDRNRDQFFVDNSVAKGLPRDCATQLAQLAAAQHVDALVVFAPGLNNSSQAGSARRRELPDYLRGWGFVTKTEGTDKPTLFNMTQVLLIGIAPDGATLSAREWGGGYSGQWTDYVAPPNLKQMPPQELDKLRPLFATILSGQAGRVLDWITVSP